MVSQIGQPLSPIQPSTPNSSGFLQPEESGATGDTFGSAQATDASPFETTPTQAGEDDGAQATNDAERTEGTDSTDGTDDTEGSGGTGSTNNANKDSNDLPENDRDTGVRGGRSRLGGSNDSDAIKGPRENQSADEILDEIGATDPDDSPLVQYDPDSNTLNFNTDFDSTLDALQNADAEEAVNIINQFRDVLIALQRAQLTGVRISFNGVSQGTIQSFGGYTSFGRAANAAAGTNAYNALSNGANAVFQNVNTILQDTSMLDSDVGRNNAELPNAIQQLRATLNTFNTKLQSSADPQGLGQFTQVFGQPGQGGGGQGGPPGGGAPPGGGGP